MPWPCRCDDPGAWRFVERTFGDCLYSAQERASFILGLLSIACWLVAQLPQVIKNARRGTAEALSPLFLANWLAGDLCNLFGCLFSATVLPTQTITAVYYLWMVRRSLARPSL
jgi:hypothetical protein